MTTWHHYPLSHPWMPTRKRKLSEDDRDIARSSSRSPPRTLPLPKRRRFDLSSNLSRLSLFEGIQPVIEEPGTQAVPSTSLTSSPSCEFEVDTDDSTMEVESEEPLHNSASIQPLIEEPRVDLPTNPEVRIRQSSSYEPEKDRIVITDLDSSEDELEEPNTQSAVPAGENNESYTVSTAYLARISKTEPPLPKPIIWKNDMSQALVLFKPSYSAKDTHELNVMYQAQDMDDGTLDSPSVTSGALIQPVDSDAMDVE